MSELNNIALKILENGKGILAADESTGTMTKRLESVNVPSTPENRLLFRETLFSASSMTECIGGVILYDETIKQETSKKNKIPELISNIGSIPGIKVDIEQVSAMPGQGVTSMFNFGQSFGILKGICSSMQLPMYFVRPAKWKKYYNLINTQKDASRTRAIEIFPYFSSQLSKKKDSNKADAILIANFYYETYKIEE